MNGTPAGLSLSWAGYHAPARYHQPSTSIQGNKVQYQYMVTCGTHGESPGCVACRHLRDGSGLRHHAVKPFPDKALRLGQAWCLECHAVVEQEDGWNDPAKAFVDIAIICTPCYRETMRRHHRVRLAA